jgi:hypothetical protein
MSCFGYTVRLSAFVVVVTQGAKGEPLRSALDPAEGEALSGACCVGCAQSGWADLSAERQSAIGVDSRPRLLVRRPA